MRRRGVGIGLVLASVIGVYACTATTDLTGLSSDNASSSSTGVGGGGGQGATGGMAPDGSCTLQEVGAVCNACLEEQCAQTACACSGSNGCVGLLACFSSVCPGGADEACAKYCMSNYEAGITKLSLLNHCAFQSCSDTCPVDPYWALDACSLCSFQNCESEANACLSDSVCYDYALCYEACRGDPVCIDGCNDQYPTAQPVAAPLASCVTTHCPRCPL